MGNKLSYSAMRTYQECPKKYELHYRRKLRERVKSGALFFGTAFDKATEAVLKDRAVDECEVFDKTFTTQEHNGKSLYIPTSTLVVYSQSDFDSDLLTEDDLVVLEEQRKLLVPNLTPDVLSAYKECATFKKQKSYRTFRKEENQFLNVCNWHSLRRKGHIMLKANRIDVLPNIREVIGTQVPINLKNGDGDIVVGFADLVCYWKDDTEPTVFDYKTSSVEYEHDCVVTSPQLTLYAHALNVRKAGYLVFRKGIQMRKTKKCEKCGVDGTDSRAKTCDKEVDGSRCHGNWSILTDPYALTQIYQDTIPERTEDIILENIDSINKAIHSELFFRNFSSCKNNYGTCAFYNWCYNNEMGDLEKLE